MTSLYWYAVGLVTGYCAGRIWCIKRGHNGWRRIAENWMRLVLGDK
jgi:hypothetical protein